MIRALLLSADGNYSEGDEQLLSPWREQPGGTLWLDIQGEITPDIRLLLQSFECNELAINDASRTRHPPKVESFDKNGFILFRGISELDDALTHVPQQLAIWVGSNYLITLHRGHSVSVEQLLGQAVADNLLQSPAVLALSLLHYAAGRYLAKLMAAEERIGDLEDQLLGERSNEALKELVAYRTRLRKLRRIFNYHQRIAETILNDSCPFLGVGESGSYHERRDLYDRFERLSSLCSLYYELCGDLVDGYISLSSHQLNNTMKILTIITAIFVPITFIAGLYGMNFDNMPELHHEYGYFFVLGIILAVAVAMVVLFKKIRWL
ncbi:Cobalt/magnesium transport protein CorA [Halioglobus japonicus]|nr:Cobalt/magnesium transport protein CorA [Halioglobus japonicus]